ncbi:adenylate cyclase type 10 isoform X4 [Ornithorhynchus anatinus]|uniref:adenylate cyclase type 10 isoform X4 n=1 Tax=Ornithorhynchus anatinus TaxID=9258 RepID=UPI0010A76BE3|nr:adenylate cyclase type 10 isoform X4 [Ornithorhynchus anatinus]
MDPGSVNQVDRAIIRIAAHLPDLIVYGEFAPQFPSLEYFDGVLMFVDISGFTAMTEKFSTAMYMDRGAEQLVEVLNRYISAIVEKVLIYGGDILKFAGDALLALWKVERRLLKNIITVVIKCSLEIHGIFEIQDSEEGLDLRVKIGLSAGHITKVVFGDELRRHFLVIGQAVEDVRFAQGLAQMNEVILSPNCWQLCDRNMIEIERIPDQRAVKVSFLKPPPMFNFDEFFTKCMTYMDFYPTRENQNLLRLACTLESNAELENFLQKYIMENILKQIDDKQLRGYLSELRPVTIVFVNLQFAEHGKIEDVGQAIQDASIHISAVLRTFRGQINKVFMFDKGCSFLCVFGFPGEKAPDEITHALESAIEIFDYCSQIFKIRVVSIGVASGTVFCGIVGHSVRHEYTVIGQKVNIAARMMMNYPGIVSCDSVTYNNCSLPSYFFKELPKQEMKGVVDPGPVYHCLGLNEKIMFGMACLTRNHQEEYPLLGRDKEIQFFVSILNDFVVSSCSRVLMFEGSAGYGKSQLIVELDFLAKSQSHRVISLGLTKISIHQAFYTIQLLMASLLGLDACKHYKERQTNLQVKVGNLIDEKVYCLLNDIFHVQFPMSREASRMSHQEKQKEIEALFTHVLEREAKQEKIIFIIDEAQFIDETSWNFMERVLQRIPIFFILSLSPFFDVPCDAAQAIMKSRDTTYMVLGEMTPADIRAKVCLDLNVASIPKELEMYLVEGSCGVPFYCEELLKNLDRHKVLLFRTLVNEDIKMNVTWDVLFKNFTKPQQVLGIFSLPSVDEGIEVCDLTKGVRLKNMSPPSTLKEISLVQLDSMSLSHQMLVRCAAIIGQTFSTELLFEVLPCWNMKMMIKALAILVESSIFYYFRNRKEFRAVMNQHSSTFEVHYRSIALKPPGGRAAGEEEQIRDLESEVTECSVMCFCKPIMQKTAYELWLKDQKTALHLKCARFLEEDAHQCDRCGNGDFIPFHHYTVDIRLNSLDLDTVKKMIHLHGIHKSRRSSTSQLKTLKKSEVFLEDLSAEQIGGKVLGFFDLILEKIKTPEENLIPIEACQCHEILESVVLPLAYHFMALGEESKALYYYLEVAAAYINVSDNYLAYIYLNEGEKLIKSLKDKKIYHRFETATFFCLKGQVCFNMGQMVLARKMLRKALKLLDRVFPYNCVSVFLQTHVEKTRHYAYLNQPNEESPPPGKKRLAQLYQQTRCLSLLWQIYSLDYTFYCKYFAHLAAMMQVNSALESQDDFQVQESDPGVEMAVGALRQRGPHHQQGLLLLRLPGPHPVRRLRLQALRRVPGLHHPERRQQYPQISQRHHDGTLFRYRDLVCQAAGLGELRGVLQPSQEAGDEEDGVRALLPGLLPLPGVPGPLPAEADRGAGAQRPGQRRRAPQEPGEFGVSLHYRAHLPPAHLSPHGLRVRPHGGRGELPTLPHHRPAALRGPRKPPGEVLAGPQQVVVLRQGPRRRPLVPDGLEPAAVGRGADGPHQPGGDRAEQVPDEDHVGRQPLPQLPAAPQGHLQLPGGESTDAAALQYRGRLAGSARPGPRRPETGPPAGIRPFPACAGPPRPPWRAPSSAPLTPGPTVPAGKGRAPRSHRPRPRPGPEPLPLNPPPLGVANKAGRRFTSTKLTTLPP